MQILRHKHANPYADKVTHSKCRYCVLYNENLPLKNLVKKVRRYVIFNLYLSMAL